MKSIKNDKDAVDNTGIGSQDYLYDEILLIQLLSFSKINGYSKFIEFNFSGLIILNLEINLKMD